jgi:acetyl-CoA carboxylase biotin carboxylase subunit
MKKQKSKFAKVLIANRGEIALRAVKTARKLGLQSVAIYSTADKSSQHVIQADEAICIGPAPSSKSYLVKNAIIHTALRLSCDAIYPGYGFLSENAEFVDLCEANDIKFIGPAAESIREMGDKSTARKLAVKNNVPVVPGSDDAYDSEDEALLAAKFINYPLLLKARAGGGGRGMQIVKNDTDFANAFQRCSAEAKNAFGDGHIYIERYFEKIRHIEVQIFGDGRGKAIALGERDCSVQRRHQKLIEEAPASILSPRSRKQLHKTAAMLAAGVKYEGAGTIEFIYDPKTTEFFFIEMNTRIQVEHPVTEMLIGIDLVEAQFLVAQGASLNNVFPKQNHSGHAIEFRINAEDWEQNFTPNPGKISQWSPPKMAGVRIDTAVYEGYHVVPFYDSMIAKLIIHAGSRDLALLKAKDAFQRFSIDGIKTTSGFHQKMLRNDAFLKNEIYTRWVDKVFLGDNK